MKNEKGCFFLFGETVVVEGPIDGALAFDICDRAEKAQKSLATYPVEKTLALLEELGKKWGDKTNSYRIKAQEKLPSITGFSKEMIELGLDEIAALLAPQQLQKKIVRELRGIPRGVEFKYNEKTKTLLQWQPLGSLFHVLSGNVFLVGVGGLIEGLLTGNTTILKMSSDDIFFMPLFLESLVSVEEEFNMRPVISQSIAAVYFKSTRTDLIEIFKNRVDGIVVWGGESAVQSFRNNLPAKTRLIIFGPKLSFAYITKEGMGRLGVEEVAKRLAFDISLWDQNACTAPQMCYVEGAENTATLWPELARQLEKICDVFPPGQLDPDAAAEIRKLHTVYEIAEIRGRGKLLKAPKNLTWTLYLSGDKTLETSPLGRTLKLVTVNGPQEIIEQVGSLRSYVQTIGLCSSAEEHYQLAQEFGAKGALRIMNIGQMSTGEVDDPHDGAYDLPQLLNLVISRIERPSSIRALKKIVHISRQAPFFKNLYRGMAVENEEDFKKLPILRPQDISLYMAPYSREMATSKNISGGHMTRTGGSTGGPAKFSWFPQKDWDAMVDAGAYVCLQCGYGPQDIVANCFLAGDLYGSFISFSDVNKAVGMTSLPFAGSATPASLVEIWRACGFNVIEGVPSALLPLLREAKKICPELTIEKMLYAGEGLPEAAREWLVDELKMQVITSFIGTTEAGLMAYQTQDCDRGDYFMLENYNYLEIVDDKNRPVPYGTMGKILVTNLKKYSFPTIRYDIGDLGKIIKKEMAGEEKIVLHYMGRHDHILAFGLMNLNTKEMEKSLLKHGAHAIQLHASLKDGQDFLSINLETYEKMSHENEELLIQQAKDGLKNDLKEFANHLGKYFTAEVKIFGPGQIPRNPRSGKFKKLIDSRAP